MSKIIDNIKNICENELALPFLYESVSMGNVRMDKQTKFPMALLLTVTDWAIDNNLGMMNETANVRLFFLDREQRRPTIDYDATTTQIMIDKCKDYAINFVQEINLSKEIGFVDETINIRTIIDYDDANVCGVVVEARIKELQGKCIPIIP